MQNVHTTQKEKLRAQKSNEAFRARISFQAACRCSLSKEAFLTNLRMKSLMVTRIIYPMPRARFQNTA